MVSESELGGAPPVDGNSDTQPEPSTQGVIGNTSVPTDLQQKLRRRYGRMIGWYGAFAFLFLSLAAYNVVRGLNAFGSLPMVIEVVLGLSFVIPAIWAYQRRKKLDAFVAEDSAEMPRHLKTWQHFAVLIISIPLLLTLVTSIPALILASSMPSDEEMRTAELDAITQEVYSGLKFQPFDTVEAICRNLADPGNRGAITQIIAKQITQPSEFLTVEERIDATRHAYMKYCGLVN